MSEEQFHKFLEIQRTRPLSGDEQATLEGLFHLEDSMRQRWDEELELDRLIGDHSEPPVASNFAAQTLAAVQKSSYKRRSPRIRLSLFWRTSLGRIAGVAALAIGMATLTVTIQRHQVRTQLSQVLSDVSDAMEATQALTGASSSSPELGELLSDPDELLEALSDFNSIRLMNSLPAESDASLLAALQ
jgi:hypothetical protein